MLEAAAITGIGAISAIGHNLAEITRNLRDGRGGIVEIEAFATDGLTVRHAAELRGWCATDHFSPADAAFIDRTAQLAIVAARQAVADSGISPDRLRSRRVALIFGICGGGIGAASGPGMLSMQGAIEAEEALDTPDAARVAMQRVRNTALYAQTGAVAADLGITGPCLTVSTACAASTSALSSALTLLRAGRVDAVVVGGADAWSRGTYAGFYSLGAMAAAPCSPFSRETGVTFGEGAGCILVERETMARERGATIHGMLLGCGTTSDAHHITAPNPGGQGLMRAMQLALDDAGVPAEAIGYINAHGTGTPDNDVAETVAVHRVFAGREPPVSSSKSFFGHTLGGAGILEFIASLAGMTNGFLPPTLNFAEARPGCDLDYVANTARPSDFDRFLSLSAAFGGVNAVAVGSRTTGPTGARVPVASDPIVVSGIGVVSPIGHGVEAFRAALRARVTGIGPITRFDTEGLGCRVAGMIGDLPARRLAPAADTRRMDAITRYAVVAATLALKDAGLAGKLAPERIGLHVAMSGGPVGSAEIFAEELQRGGIAGLGAKFFPPIVFATVGGQVGQACQIRGASFIFMDGAGAGLQAMAHAHDFLRQHQELDALVVIAADEIAPGMHRMLDRLGLLAADSTAPPYAAHGSGVVPGEGAVALVLERQRTAVARTARVYGRIDGVGMASEGRNDDAVDRDGAALAEAARRALEEAGGGAPDLVYGLARGDTRHDRREEAALRTVLNNAAVPISSLNGQLGLADATSGLYAVAAGLLGLRYGEAYAAVGEGSPDGLDIVRGEGRTGDFQRVLVLGSSQHGNSAALLLGQP